MGGRAGADDYDAGMHCAAVVVDEGVGRDDGGGGSLGEESGGGYDGEGDCRAEGREDGETRESAGKQLDFLKARELQVAIMLEEEGRRGLLMC